MISNEAIRMAREWGAPPRAIQTASRARDTDAIRWAKEFIEAWQRDDVGMMVLAGGVGVGKTVAAVWAMMAIPQNQHGAWGIRRFRHISDLCEMGFGDEERKERQQLRHAHVLVIDDLGTEHLTEKIQTMLDGLINARYEDTGATIITTNLPSEQFSARYGKRIYDRLCGRGAWYDIPHESLRGGGA